MRPLEAWCAREFCLQRLRTAKDLYYPAAITALSLDYTQTSDEINITIIYITCSCTQKIFSLWNFAGDNAEAVEELVAWVISVKMYKSCFPVLNFLSRPLGTHKKILIFYNVQLIEFLYIIVSSFFFFF